MHRLGGVGRRFPGPADLARVVPARLRWPLAIALFAGSVAYAFLHLHRRIRPWNDFAFVYAAGRTWLDGHVPYDFERWNAHWAAIRPPETDVSQPMPFMYPPYWAPLAVALGSLPWHVASRFWDALNVLEFFAICALCLELGAERFRGAIERPAAWVFVALAGYNPSLHYSVWQSQMTVLATLGVTGAFWAWRERRNGWLAVFGFIAALKPQLGLLTLFYIFVSGGYGGLLWAAGAALGIGFFAVLPHLAALPTELARIYALHLELKFNAPDQFASVPALVASHLSRREFMLVGPCLALVAVTAMAFRIRRDPTSRPEPLLELGSLVALTGALMPVHGYDLVVYTPIAILAYERRSSWLVVLVAALFLCAARAHIFARFLHVEIAAGYLTGMMAILLFALTTWRSKDGFAPDASGGSRPFSRVDPAT